MGKMQQSFDEKLAAIQVEAEQTANNVKQISTWAAHVDATLKQQTADSDTCADQISGSSKALRDQLEELHAKLDGIAKELHDIKVPPLSIQSLVENAVKHGITPQRAGGEFAVTASLANARLCIEVCDTGPGFDVAAIRAGHGLDNLVGRLDALYGDAARLNVLRRNGWCVVQMMLPCS